MTTRLALAAFVALLWSIGLLAVQARVPLASEADQALAPLAVNRDGTEITVRAPAPDTLRLCVEPAAGKFGPRRCFTVGDIRAGLVVRK